MGDCVVGEVRKAEAAEDARVERLGDRHRPLAGGRTDDGERHRRRARNVEDAAQLFFNRQCDRFFGVPLVHELVERIEAQHHGDAALREEAGEGPASARTEEVTEPEDCRIELRPSPERASCVEVRCDQVGQLFERRAREWWLVFGVVER